MIDKIKAELENIRKQKTQAVAQYNACIGAEHALNAVLEQVEKSENKEDEVCEPQS